MSGTRVRWMLGVGLAVGAVLLVAGCAAPQVVGTVTDAATGRPAVGVEVALYRDDDAVLMASTYTDAGGHYRFGGVPAGTYRLRMSDDAWYAGVGSWAQAASVSIGTSAVPGDATMSPPSGSIGGMARSAGSGQSGVAVTAVNAVTGVEVASATTSSSGQFLLDAVPSAPYKVRFARSGYATTWYGGADQTSAATVVVHTGAATTGISADLTIGSDIAGTIDDGAGPVAGLTVLALRQPDNQTIATTSTGVDGAFHLDGLAAGGYHLQVADPSGAYRVEWWGTTGVTTADAASTPVFTTTAGHTTVAGRNRVAGRDCDPAVYRAGVDLTGTVVDGKHLERSEERRVGKE